MNQHILFRDSQMEPRIASYLGMFNENRNRLNRILEDVSDEMLDFTPNPENVESIGTLLLHIAAVEWGWIFGDIDGVRTERPDVWKHGFHFWLDDTEQITGKSLQYYLDELSRVRELIQERMMKMTTDDDLLRVIESEGESHEVEYILFHLINHEAQHFGQISLLKRLFKAQ